MDPATKRCASLFTGGEAPEWTKGLEIRIAEKATGDPLEHHLHHAIKMAEWWTRKRDIAMRQSKHWTKRVNYYQNRKNARPKG